MKRLSVKQRVLVWSAAVLVAMAVLETGTVWYYLPVLILSGTAAGVAVGLLGGIAVERLRRAFAHFSG